MPQLSPEQEQLFYETMPALASAHASDGPFNLLDTDPNRYGAQLPEIGFLPAYGPGERTKDLDDAIEITSLFASNIGDIAQEIFDNNDKLLTQVEEAKYRDGKTVIFVGDHDSFDNIIYPDIALSYAMSLRDAETDKPKDRTTIMAKQLGWYGLGTEAVVELLLNYGNVALTAPGTISGKKTEEATRDYLNSWSLPQIQHQLAKVGAAVTFAYAGQTNRHVINPFTDETLFSVQFTPSKGSLEFMMHPNVVVIPFATHRAEASKRMTFAYGEPREISSMQEGLDLGDEIAYLSWRISGQHTIQAIDRKQFDMLSDQNPELGTIKAIRKIVADFARKNRERYQYDNPNGYYVVGSKESVVD